MDRDTTLKAAAELVARALKEIQWLSQLMYLDHKIDKNRKKLDKGFINIPFTNYRLFDDIGMIKHNIPTCLEKDREMVSDYNSILKKYLGSVDETTCTVDELAHALEIDANGNYFEKLALILVELHVTDEEAKQYHLIRR